MDSTASTDIVATLHEDKSVLSVAFTATKEKLSQLLKVMESGGTLSSEQINSMRSEYEQVMKSFNETVEKVRGHITEVKA